MSEDTDQQEKQIQAPEDTAGQPSRGRSIAFRVLVVIFAIFHVLMSPLPFLVLAFFIKSEPGNVSHQVHELSFASLFAISFVGLLSQLRRPERKLAGMYQVIVPLYVIIPLVVIVDRVFDPTIAIFLVIPLLLVWLHPAREQLRRPGWSPSLILVILAGVAAVPLIVFAVDQIATGVHATSAGGEILRDLPEEATEKEIVERLDEAGIPESDQVEILHSGHWVGMGAFALTLAGLSLLGALRPRGWRLLVWSSAAALTVYALASVKYPGDASSAPAIAAALTIAWAVLFVLMAERDVMDVARAEGTTT
jgi:hypothetical protein